ncbi:AI-2E family transporter [Dulcicalothrix desertica]|uniref:AI-2E family transporter n=1 Tax=Dulcicalothrix desertica TaxID=32056 RepID=UPI000F8C4640|nr:AI-2E family transporter [Dulcicalothrix desertica]TWH41031.1 putative PurR-regulated permease PerM [Dulcicalothrix desertica PCC 7102]
MNSLNRLVQLLIITLLFPLVFLNGWLAFRVFDYFKPIITTIVLASLLAFILNFPVSILHARGVKRGYAVGIVFISALLLIFTLGVTILPLGYEQFNEMTKVIPEWIDSGQQKLLTANSWAANRGFDVDFSRIATELTDKLPSEVEFFGNRLFTFAVEAIDSVSEALVTVVFTFYLLSDGARIWDGIFKKLPTSFAVKLQESFQQNFRNYLIGQVALAVLMGVSLTVVFLVLQVPFGLVFGLGIGVLSLIPFGDVVSLAVITLIIASHDIWLAARVLAVSVVIDQLIDQAVAPRLLGSFTGLRPIWVLTSLLVGTYVGGLLGLLIAVPVAGVINDALKGWVDKTNAVEGDAPSMLTTDSAPE